MAPCSTHACAAGSLLVDKQRERRLRSWPDTRQRRHGCCAHLLFPVFALSLHCLCTEQSSTPLAHLQHSQPLLSRRRKRLRSSWPGARQQMPWRQCTSSRGPAVKGCAPLLLASPWTAARPAAVASVTACAAGHCTLQRCPAMHKRCGGSAGEVIHPHTQTRVTGRLGAQEHLAQREADSMRERAEQVQAAGQAQVAARQLRAQLRAAEDLAEQAVQVQRDLACRERLGWS